MGKIILYVAISEDGFIADKDGGVDWLPQEPDKNDICGYQALLNRVSYLFMGSKSYRQILGFGEWAWPDHKTFVFSSDTSLRDYDNIRFVAEDIPTFMPSFTTNFPDGDIWLLGGAELAASFKELSLIDEYILTVIPTKLGEGVTLSMPDDDFVKISTKDCMNGIVQEVYISR